MRNKKERSFKRKAWLLFPVIIFVIAALVQGASEKHHHECLSKGNHGYDEEESHEGEKGNDLALTIEEILQASCEHALPTYQCAECRYEVGVAKVDTSLLIDEKDPEKGLVKVVPATIQKISTALNTTGEVQLNENAAVHITPAIEGIIRSVAVDIGAEVQENDPLFTIESPVLGESVAEYLKNKSLIELRAKTFAREKALFEQKISPEQDMLEAKASLHEAEAAFKAARQRLQVLGLSEHEIANASFADDAGLTGNLTIRAPSDGTIIEKHAVVGERVEAASDVMLLANLNTVWVWADIYESDFRSLLQKRKDGPIPVEIRQGAFPDELFRGQLDYVGATMDEKTRTVKVRAAIANNHKHLRPGLFCEVTILLVGQEEVLAVPEPALLSDEGVHFIYKHLKDDYYVRRQVTKGREYAGNIEIVEGVNPGELIVADGAFLLKSDTLRSKMGAGCAD